MAEVNRLFVYLNANRMYHDLITHLIKGIQIVIDQLVTQMRSGTTEGRIDGAWVARALYDEAMDKIAAEVGNEHLWAWIDNYGSGSKMDKGERNTSFDEYVNYDWYFNDFRSTDDLAVISRPKGKYKTRDWKNGSGFVEKYGRGLMSPDGTSYRNLEEDIMPSGKPRYQAQEPKYWFDNAFDNAKKLIDNAIEEGFATFDFTRYLEGIE